MTGLPVIAGDNDPGGPFQSYLVQNISKKSVTLEWSGSEYDFEGKKNHLPQVTPKGPED